MTREEFAIIAAGQLSKCKDVLSMKETIYSDRDDRLANFKKAAKLQNRTPEGALFGMMAKHIVALSDFIETKESGGVVSSDEWDEKITDSINYLLLLKGLLAER